MSVMPTLSYCLSNVDTQTRRALRACALPTIEDICLQRCGDCYSSAFVLLDDQLITGATHTEILNHIFDATRLEDDQSSDQPTK